MRCAMDARVLLDLAVRNVNRNKARSTLTLAAIAAGTAALILSGGFVHDLIFQLGEAVIHSQSGHLQIARTGYFESGSRSPGKFLVAPSATEALAINGMPHVQAAMRRMAFSGLLSNGK